MIGRFASVKLVDVQNPESVVCEASTLRELAQLSGKSYTRIRKVSSDGSGMIRVGKVWTKLVVELMPDSRVERA